MADKYKARVKVIVRVRPDERAAKEEPCSIEVLCKDTLHQATQLKVRGEVMEFDQCFSATTSQEELFQREMAPTIPLVLQGMNMTVLAYGPAKNGKTYTLEGTAQSPGLVPRTMKQVFHHLHTLRGRVTVHTSVVEIQNNKVFDLLDAKTDKLDLPIRQSATGTIAVQGVTSQAVETLHEFTKLYELARAAQSRQSHRILIVTVDTTSANGPHIVGKFQFIDLACSEENRRRSLEPRLSESSCNLMSFFVLGKVLNAVNDGRALQHVPFRDSKLTRLLHGSLGAPNCLATFICNVSSASVPDALPALQYASKARQTPETKSTSRRSVGNEAVRPTSSPMGNQPNAVEPQPVGEVKPTPEERLRLWRRLRLAKEMSPSDGKKRSQDPPQLAPHKRLKLESPPKPSILVHSCATPKTPCRIPMRRESIAPLMTRKPLGNLTNVPTAPTITPAKDNFKTPEKTSAGEKLVRSPRPVEQRPLDRIRKLLHMAMEYEKRERLSAALAVYRCTNSLLPDSSTKLKARIDRLQAAVGTHFDAPMTSITDTLKTILAADIVETLNKGSKQTILELQGVGEKRASVILGVRAIAPFTSIDDLRRAGMTEKQVARLVELNVDSIANQV
ncbi:kinesin motor domain containing protein [Achlya hypogyna]|uniref:Kinesin motor domain containing protein n=1 Tax=Achlya hypogyna TaxID=1202772 RepID=A0A1V9YTR3_ACHHY|nr:kinesin motor domain containing protein [Achlya hypogyna]